MDSFTERMVERAQKRKERLKIHMNTALPDSTTQLNGPMQNSNAVNVEQKLYSSEKVGDKPAACSGVIKIGESRNVPANSTHFRNARPEELHAQVVTSALSSRDHPEIPPSSIMNPPDSSIENFDPSKGSVLQKASRYEPCDNAKRDPIEFSLAERKALFERNKGSALLPKVPFGQPLPAQKAGHRVHRVGCHPHKLPLKLPSKPVQNRPCPVSKTTEAAFVSSSSSPLPPPPPPPKPDHLRSLLEKMESNKSAVNEETASINTELKDHDTSFESLASSQSSLGQKIVRLAQKRRKELEDDKKQIGQNILSASECELDDCGRNSLEDVRCVPLSGASSPKQYRSSDSFESSTDPCSDHFSTVKTEQSKQREEIDADSQQSLTHTVSFYRKIQNQTEKPDAPLVKKVVHQSVNSVSTYYSESNENLEREAVSAKIADLLQKISAETIIISQAMQALNLCSSTVEFLDSREQIEAERLLLLASHKRQATMNEVQRLKVEGTVRPSKPIAVTLSDQGSLSVSEIALPVRCDAIQIPAKEEKCHHFVCLLKCDEAVLGTSVISATVQDLKQASKGVVYLQFPNMLTFPKLYSDFRVTVEIYNLLAQSKEALPHDVKYRISSKKDSNKLRITSKKQKASWKITAPSNPNPAGPTIIRASMFSMVGYIVFSLREVQRTQFTLNRVTHTSPVEGKVQLKLSCELSPTVEKRGFLTMFEDVSGFGAWHRRWCLLKGDSLSYWKYPDDERTKLPIDTIDLNTCTAQTINVVSRDICARQNTFLLETIRPARDEDVDSLVLVRHSAHTMVRYLLSTDTKEERIEWCSTLNKALDIIRAWRRK